MWHSLLLTRLFVLVKKAFARLSTPCFNSRDLFCFSISVACGFWHKFKVTHLWRWMQKWRLNVPFSLLLSARSMSERLHVMYTPMPLPLWWICYIGVVVMNKIEQESHSRLLVTGSVSPVACRFRVRSLG
jgi:hypothetical protein